MKPQPSSSSACFTSANAPTATPSRGPSRLPPSALGPFQSSDNYLVDEFIHYLAGSSTRSLPIVSHHWTSYDRSVTRRLSLVPTSISWRMHMFDCKTPWAYGHPRTKPNKRRARYSRTRSSGVGLNGPRTLGVPYLCPVKHRNPLGYFDAAESAQQPHGFPPSCSSHRSFSVADRHNDDGCSAEHAVLWPTRRCQTGVHA